MEHIGSIFGKRIFLNEEIIKCDEKTVIKFVSNLSTLNLMKSIADLLPSLEVDSENANYNGVPINTYLLILLSKYVVLYSNNNTYEAISCHTLSELLRMGHGLVEKEILEPDKSFVACMLRYSYRHFPFQVNLLSVIARYYYLYVILWSNIVPDMDIMNDIKTITGIPYRELLYFTHAFSGSRESYFRPYNEELLADFSDKTGLSFSGVTQKRFLDWASCDIVKAREYDGTVNLFHKYPIYKCDNTQYTLDNVYINVSKHLLHDKATIGMFYDLSELHAKPGTANKFRESFGHVFQEYVGIVLRQSFKTWNVEPEITFSKSMKTVDWFVWKDNKAILIEVKSNPLSYKSKYEGNIAAAKIDVQRTIGKAYSQLEKTIDNIENRIYPEMYKYSSITEYQTVVVTVEPLYYAKAIAGKLLDSKMYTRFEQHHIIGIDDFEYICHCQSNSESLYELLKEKNTDEEKRYMDFSEYTYYVYPDIQEHIPFHSTLYKDMLP